MSLVSYVVVFTCVWWLVFFMLLPVGNKTDPNPKVGHADSAPMKPRIFLKAVVTTLIAVAVSWLVLYLIDSGYLGYLMKENFK